jgi:hypothetical protein
MGLFCKKIYNIEENHDFFYLKTDFSKKMKKNISTRLYLASKSRGDSKMWLIWAFTE